MNDWTVHRFADLLEDGAISYGIVQPGSHTETDSIPILRVNNIRNGTITTDGVLRVARTIEDKYRRTRLKGGELLITVVGSVGECAIVPHDLAGWNVARAVSVARIKPQFDTRFVKYAFRLDDVVFQMYGNTNDTVQPTLNLAQLKDLELTLPPLAEQKAIAAVLSSLDDKIDLLHRQNKTLEALAETLFRQWFVEEAQEDWAEGCLGEYVEVMRGLSYKGSGLSEAGLGLPMHNLNSVYEGGGYKYEGIKYYSGDYKDRHLVYPGDVIVTNTEQGHEHRLIGCPAIVPDFYGEYGLFSQHVYRLRLLGNQLTVPFLYHLLMSNDVREQIIGATNGSTVNMLPKDGIEWAKFRMPPTSRIKAFTAFAEPRIDKGHKIHKSIRTLEKLRDTLLPKLMSGEVRVAL
jgi:type I restriction enzyme S subunit